MFGWFKKKPDALPYDDTVWLDESARMDALVRAAQGGRVLFVSYFEETDRAVARALEAADIPHGRAGVSLPDAKAALILAERVGHLPRTLPENMAVCVTEHHPHPEALTALLTELQLHTEARPRFHVAIDDPLMRRFGGDRVKDLMVRMGMGRDEPVEHTMVKQALANARAKVAEKVKHPRSARSMEEWLALNLG